MKPKVVKECLTCKNCTIKYADGYIYKDWSGRYGGNPDDLPKEPDITKYWTYIECKFNSKGLKLVNLMNDCNEYKAK